jgi:hypothetical protein
VAAEALQLTPFDTNWRKGGGATHLTTQDLFFGDAISIPTAPSSPRGRICCSDVARMPTKPRQKKVKQPKPKKRIFPPPKRGKADFIHPDETSVRAPDNFD